MEEVAPIILEDTEESAENEDALDQRVIELSALFELSRTLNSSLHLDAILDNVLLAPMGRLLITRGAILIREEGARFRLERVKGIPRDNVGRVFEFDAPLAEVCHIEDGANEPLASLCDLGLRLIVPIRIGDHAIGYILFGHRMAARPAPGTHGWSDADLEFLRSFSNIAATSIQNARIFAELDGVNRRLDKKIQELNTLFEIGKELNATLETEKILNALSYALMGEMMVLKCAIFLRVADECVPGMSKGFTAEEQRLFGEYHPGFVISQPSRVDEIPGGDRETLERLGIEVLVPMSSHEQPRGLICIGPRITGTDFVAEDLEFLSTLGNQAMISLDNARLFQEALEKQRMEEELAIARQIQRQLLPQVLPRLESVDLSAINVPSREIGGDYYDLIQLDDHRLGVVIADVSGKGAPAALLTAYLQATLRALATVRMPVSEVLRRANGVIHTNTTADKFITCFYGVLDLSTRSFKYCNAGHNPPYHFRPGQGLRTLDAGGLILGMMPGVPYQEGEVILSPGDWVLMFTDGVTEAMNEDEEEFEERRVEALLSDVGDMNAARFIESLVDAVRAHAGDAPQQDDITALALRFQ